MYHSINTPVGGQVCLTLRSVVAADDAAETAASRAGGERDGAALTAIVTAVLLSAPIWLLLTLAIYSFTH